ncbi:MAG: multicopper oxidase domain-containing protein [Opitutales bacterium]|nr:multicopper oxidase domain-containing protein [Opitutales bacterium]
MKTIPYPSHFNPASGFWGKYLKALPLAAIALWIQPTELKACDSCNLAFTDEVMSERANTAVGRDLLRAMENQRNLPLDGFSSEFLKEAQSERLEANRAARGLTEAPISEGIPVATDGDVEAAVAQAAQLQAGNREVPDYMRSSEFIEIIERDYALPTTPTSMVPQDAPVDKSFTIRLHEGQTYIGNGVVYDGFLTDGKIPGPTIIVQEGDVVEFNIVNDGSVPHGASIHAAYTQTSKYIGSIGPGTTKSVRFRAMHPGVYMYHCAPGGHAIPMHVLFGQYGMMVVEPKTEKFQLEKELGHAPNLELYLTQHEIYASGKNAIEGDAAYTMFNGRLFRYVEEPIMVNPGDYVRVHFLNVGPNLLSTFHLVGIIWDYVYWQGHPKNIMTGGQTVTAGPSDSFTIEFRIPPDEGAYTMLTHAVGSASRGAIGLLVADASAELEPHRRVLQDGPEFTEAEMAEYSADAVRVVSPFKVGTHPVDQPVVYGPETEEVHISIIGNSYWPKVVQIAPGTKVTWTNEDVFTYLAGEYSGIHNAVALSAPPESEDGGFVSPLLAHGESYSYVFEEEWEYEYICTPHPYMKAKIIVKQPAYDLSKSAGGPTALSGWALPLLGICLLISTGAWIRSRRS